MPSVRESGTNENHAPIGQARNGGSSANSQEIPISMDNMCPYRNENQYVTFPSGEAFMGGVCVRYSKRIRKCPHRYDP